MTFLTVLKNNSLLVSSYHANKVFFIQNVCGQVIIAPQRFDRPMGLWSDGNGLIVATKNHIGDFFTGELNAHEVVKANELIIFVNTKFSCLSKIENNQAFPYWIPPFITELLPEDRCHINCIGLRDNIPRYVTACSTSNIKSGWRDCRDSGGVLIDIISNEIVCDNLSMPHSPRWYQNKLWLLNSGAGDFGCIENNRFIPLVSCPGFARGLVFWENYAIIGVSEFRSIKLNGLEIEKKLSQQNINPVCGLILVDLTSNLIVDILRINQHIKKCVEIFDVVFAS